MADSFDFDTPSVEPLLKPREPVPSGASTFDFSAPPLPPVDPIQQIEKIRQLSTPQFDATGKAVAGSVAAKENLAPHPLTIAALENFDMTADIDSNLLAISTHVADTVGGFDMVPNENGDLVKQYRSITPKMVQNMPRASLDKMLEREDVKFALRIDSVVRKRLAQDAEAVAILHGEIPIILAAEGAFVTSTRLREGRERTEFEEVAGITPDDSVGIIHGLATAVQRGYRMQSAAKEVAEAFAVLAASGNPEEAVEKFLKASKHMSIAMGLERSDWANQFLTKLKTVDQLKFGEGVAASLKLLKDNPLAATALIQEVVAEQAGPLAASLAATFVGTPFAGMVVSAGLMFGQEQFAFSDEALKNIKEKFGHDLNTREGITAFVENEAAQQSFLEFGVKRAIPITAANLANFGLLRALARANTARLVKVAGALAGSTSSEFGAEIAAQVWSKDEYLLSEAVLEAMAGGHPVTVGLNAFISGAADINDFHHARAAKIWDKSGKVTADTIKGIPAEKLAKAADVLSEKLKAEGIDTVYIPADKLKGFDQDGRITNTLGLSSEAVDKASRDGQDVAIDAATYIRHILGAGGFDALQRHTKFDEGGMTAHEAEEYEKDDVGGQIRERIIAEAKERASITSSGVTIDEAQLTKLNDDTETIKKQVADQLEATGVYTGSKVDLFAQITAQQYATRAVRHAEATGQPVDAMQLFLEENLQIQADADLAAAQGFEQIIKDNQAELAQAATRRQNREITEKQYLEVIARLKPVTPYKQKDLPVPETKKAMRSALKEGQKGRIGKGIEWIGKLVGLRLDIPAYENHDTWVPTIHDSAGKPVAHESVAHIVGNITFTQPGDKAEIKAGRVGRGETAKAPFAQINGTLKSVSPAAVRKRMNEIFNDPEWVQVGYDPRRHTFFYNRETQQPIVGATEVMQVGPLVMARNPEYGATKDFLFQAPRPSQVDMRIRQLAFENDVRSGQVTVTEDNIVEVNQLREELGLTPLELTPIGFEQDGFQPVGTPLPPKVADPAPEELKKAQASTERSGAAVSARLPIIIPESGRVAQSPYTVGHPDGRSWTDLTDAELDVRGAGVTLTQADLDGIMEGVLKDVSKAAQDAVESTGAAFQLTPEQLDNALKLDLRAQLWYELSGEMFKIGLPSLTFQEHFMFLDLIGATSARARPFDNLARALAVLSQFKRGVPIDTDLAMPTAVTKALGRGGKDVTNLTGNKTGQFSNTMALTAGMETSYPIPVNDVWVGVMFGITDEQLTSNQSLHEVMALYQIRLAELVRAKGNSGTSVPHQPWHIQARGWVQLRSEDAGIDTTTAEKVEGNDYAAEWPHIIKLLRDAGVPGISKDGVLSEKALMSPLFIDALRPTVKGFRDAPKATVEAGTLLTTKGRHAADLVEAGLAVGDTLTESKYYAAIMSSLSKMSLKTFKQGSLLPLLRSIADGTFDISRMQTGTKDRPFDVAGWFEGRLSPNIRIPLQALSTENFLTDPETGELRWSEISVFNAVVGKALSQAAMATSEVLPVNVAEPARNGYIHGLSVFVRDNAGVTPEQLKSFAEALPEGFGLSSYTLPGGVVIDINPRYDLSTDSLVGIEDAALEPAIDALGVPKGVAGTLDHDFRSVYDEASEYDVIIEQFIKSVKAKATEQLLAVEKTVIRKVKEKDKDGKTITKEVEEVIRLDPAVAAGIADAASPVASVARRKIPASIRGRVSTVAKALEGRLSNFATGQQGYTDLAQDLETNLEKDFGRAAKRIEKAGGTAPVLAPAPADQEAVPLEQTGPADAPRGRFVPSDMMPDQDGNPINLIQIFEKADATTFLHESGHFWLEQLKADTAAIGGQFKTDFDAVINWMGNNSLSIKDEAVRRARKGEDKAAVAALQGMSDAQVKTYIKTAELRGEGHTRWISISMHEQFARGTENYFARGKAPSIALASAFNAFKVWIMSVYRRMRTAGDINFSPEVNEVLDRMLATDEEISAVNGQYAMAALLTTAEEAGMTPAKFQQYQKEVAESVQQSKANQLAKQMREISREKTAEWDAEREALRDGVTSEVANLRQFRLLYTLTQGGLADGSSVKGLERIPPLDQAALQQLLEEHDMTLKDLPRVGNKGIYAKSEVEGDTSSPGMAAAVFGYQDVTEMLIELLDTGKFKDAVEVELDAQMKEEFGSIDDSGDQDAIASIHGDHTAKVLAAELDALRTTEPAFKPAFIKQYAIEHIAEMKTHDIRHQTFSAAERRHAKLAGRALRKGDRAEAYKHQFHRLVNHRMAAEALRVRKDIETKSRFMRDLQKHKKRPTLEKGYLSAIHTILEATDFAVPVSDKRRLTIELIAINEFIKKAEEDDGAILQIPAWLTAKDALTNVREMTYQQFNELHESVKSLEKQGKLAKKLRIGRENKDRQTVIALMQTRLGNRDRTKVSKILGKWGGPPAGGDAILEAGLSRIAQADAGLLRVEFLLEALDGEPLGPWHQALYQPFIDAMNDKADLTQEVVDLIQSSVRNLPDGVRNGLGKRVDVGDLGTPGMKMTRGSLIMLALNTGNESNLDKVIRGMGGDPDSGTQGLGWNINEELLDKAFEQFTKQEWDFIQGIWDHAEKLKPKAFDIYEAENGIAPDEIVPRTVSTKFGDRSGGYFPMMYDHSRPYNAQSSKMAKRTALEQMQATIGRGSVNSSMTKVRTGFAAPVLLDFEQITRGFDNTIHFITHYEAVRNASKILNDDGLRFALEDTVGKEYATMLENWVSALAANGGDRPPMTWVDRLAGWAARNTTMAVLGASYTTLAAQTLGLTSALDRLTADQKTYGPFSVADAAKDLAHGLALAPSPENYNMVIGKSIMMRDRRDNYDREVRGVLRAARNRIEAKLTTIKDKTIFEWGMQAIAEAQFFTVDLPTWTAAYNRALRNDPGDDAGAVAYADRTVRLSQSSGNLMDLSETHREAVGLKKVLTMFYTWFSALYGMLHEVSSEFRNNVRSAPVSAISRAATRAFILLTLQGLGMALIRGELPDWDEEDEEKDNLLQYMAKDTAKTALGTIPIVRDIANAALSDWGYSGSPVSIFGEAFDEAVDSLGYLSDPDTEEIDEMERTDLLKKLKPMILFGGIATGAPAIQLNRSLDGAAAYFDDAYNWHWGDLFRGYDEDRAVRRDN